MDLTHWLVAQHDDTAARLRAQVLDLVPPERRTEQPGGGSPILWNTFHLARHAALALDVLEPGAAPLAPDWLRRLTGPAGGAVPVAGLDEALALWADELPSAGVDAYLTQVLASIRGLIADPALDFDAVPDVTAGLSRAGLGVDDVGRQRQPRLAPADRSRPGQRLSTTGR